MFIPPLDSRLDSSKVLLGKLESVQSELDVLLDLTDLISTQMNGGLTVMADFELKQKLDRAVHISNELLSIELTDDEKTQKNNELEALWLDVVRLSQDREKQIQNGEWTEYTHPKSILAPENNTLQ